MNNQMNNAVRKIHNLHSSGAVTVTGLNQPRIIKQKSGAAIVASGNTHNTQQQSHLHSTNRCYICDDPVGGSQPQHILTETQTMHTATKFPNKIGQLVGEAYIVIVSVEDVVCTRCTNLLNYLDRLENDVERVRSNLMSLLHKKYGLYDEGGGGATTPPIKMQKMNSGAGARTVDEVNSDINRVRKTVSSGNEAAVVKQTPSVSAVQQMKISTQAVPQNSAGTQTLQRKATKIYKCLSCDFKTSDMRLFNNHYENCKQQNFQCKNCRKIFPNFGAMKLHMVREHNTTMDNTCAVCHINFVNDPSLRKHMETNHSTNVLVTSTTTLPVPPAADAITSGSSTALYTCNHCQFKSTDKAVFDEHFRKHLSGAKPKPFKCRLCAQRFETREAATVHAKQHQPNYFKCGTCSMSFPKRELLVKHFEVHQSTQNNQPVQQQQQQQQQAVTQNQSTPVVKQATKQQAASQNILTTQKLLQEHIDEALSENVSTAGGGADVGSTAANNIRFFSCHICSLTFIQENYYNQHMDAHRRDSREGGTSKSSSGGTAVTSSVAASNSSMLHPSATALLSEDTKGDIEAGGGSSQETGGGVGISEADIESIFEKMHSDKNDTGPPDTDTSPSVTKIATTNAASTSDASQNSGENLVITSQRGSGGITFNITIPQTEDDAKENNKSKTSGKAPVSVSIDMPELDQAEEGVVTTTTVMKTDEDNDKADESENDNAETKSATAPVSMPSLDDENDGQDQPQSQPSTEESTLETNKTVEIKVEKGLKNLEKPKSGTTHKSNMNSSDAEANISGDAPEVNSEPSEHASTSGDIESSATSEQITASGEHQVAMELDEAMQAQVESGQIKFILNENGQLLQLDNHIITDAEGNQILVQDPEQIQQLLQSAGLLQSGDGLDGETLQMMTDANGQMVLVQGENNETQLIDASLLNADGQLVIQQGHDGDLGEGAHVIGEDGTRIPVSVSYTADGQPIVRVQQQVLDSSGEGGEHIVLDKEATTAEGAAQDTSEEASNATADDGDARAAAGGRSGGDFFPLEDLMQQSSENKTEE